MSAEWLGPEPIYRQLARILAARIQDGTYRPGHPIASTAALCEEFSVSHKTVRAATAILVEQGLLVGAPGRGMYVTGTDGIAPAGPEACEKQQHT
jgi:GntR family transcriptional regulator